MRKVTLSKGAALWHAGDAACTIAILETGAVAIRTPQSLVGVASARTLLGESALFSVGGAEQQRTASIAALEDDTTVVEYPPERVKAAIESGDAQIAPFLLRTLIGQICRNLLIVLSGRSLPPVVETPLVGLMESLVAQGQEVVVPSTWDDFMLSFRFLFDLRDHTGRLREQLAPQVDQMEAAVKASDLVTSLFREPEALGFLNDLIQEEKEHSRRLDQARQG